MMESFTARIHRHAKAPHEPRRWYLPGDTLLDVKQSEDITREKWDYGVHKRPNVVTLVLSNGRNSSGNSGVNCSQNPALQPGFCADQIPVDHKILLTSTQGNTSRWYGAFFRGAAFQNRERFIT